MNKKNIMNRYILFNVFLISSFNLQALNLLFITNTFPHYIQQFIQDQIVEFIKNGHNISIHSFKSPQHGKMNKDVIEYNLVEKTTYGSDLPALSSFDIVYVQFGNHGSRVIEQARKKEFFGRIVVCFRGNDLSAYLNKKNNCYDQLFKEADLFLPVCKFFKDRLLSLGCSESKIIVHHSAINTDIFIFQEHEINIAKKLNLISVSRLTEKKGLEYAIKAVALLKKKYPNIKYTIIGDVDTEYCFYKNYIQKLVIDLDLEKNIFFYGWAMHEEIIKLFNQSDIFLLPSITASDGDQEGIANALKEAMAAGLPVIATNHAGTAELVEHEQTGLLVEERDIIGLVKSVQLYIECPEKVKKITKQARKKIEKEFAINSTVAKLECIFKKLLKKRY